MTTRSRAGIGGAPVDNLSAQGHGAPVDNLSAQGHGAPIGNLSAQGHLGAGGAPTDNLNALGHDGSNAGAPLRNTNAAGTHRAAGENKAQIAYDALIEEFQRKASCADEPFDVPIDKKDQSEALARATRKLKNATRILACAVCATSFCEDAEEGNLLPTTMNEPPPHSFTTHLRVDSMVNSIYLDGTPNPRSLIDQYSVPLLEGLHDGWKVLALLPQGFYQIVSKERKKVEPMFVFPLGSFEQMHVGIGITHASCAKACVCTDCHKSLLGQNSLPQFAIANDLAIGTYSLPIETPNIFYITRP
jgi:hypothetical protein